LERLSFRKEGLENRSSEGFLPVVVADELDKLINSVMDGAIPIEVSVLCVLRREENSRYRLLLVI
jgi:hypothetical protein